VVERELRVDSASARCAPAHGFVITSLRDEVSGAEALWRRSGFEPAPASRALGPSGDGSAETFDELFVGGCFEMFPVCGLPGELDGRPTLLHGELVRLPWSEEHVTTREVAARVAAVRTPFAARRTCRLEDDGTLVCETTVANVGGEPASYAWGQHPCLARETFAGGRIELRATRCWVPEPPLAPAAATLAGGGFAWPAARGRDGEPVDLALVPGEADGRLDHVCLELADGMVRVTAPRVGCALELRFDLACCPYALLWQDYRAAGASWWGAADTLALESWSTPGRGVDDAVAAGALRVLQPGETASTRWSMRWTAL